MLLDGYMRPGFQIVSDPATFTEFEHIGKFEYSELSEVGIPDTPTEAIIKSKPGDVVIIGGNTGVVVRDASGRLVVIDGNGSVMCIIGPAGLELP